MNTELVNIIGDMAGIVPLGRGTASLSAYRAAAETSGAGERVSKCSGGHESHGGRE